MDIPRTALVTGAGRGIGAGIATALARSGYALGLLGRTAAHLDEVAGRLRADGATVAVAVADVVDGSAVRAGVRTLGETLGGIGLLVNNAGVIERRESDLAADDVEDVWRVIETNVRGPLLVTHAVLAGMLARGGGRVLNINSGAGHRPQDGHTGYAISKGALARLTTELDHQYRARGIRAIDLAPGVVATDMTAAMSMHAGRTAWTDVTLVGELVRAFGDGELDALSGRFVRAGVDTVASLQAAAGRIVQADARTLRVPSYGADDPM